MFSQQKSRVYVDQADSQLYDEAFGKDIERLIGNVILHHDSTVFYCDSAHLNSKSRNFNAYGNVHIHVNDTVDVYGDKLFYDGEKKIADIFDNVKLIDRQTTLTTEHLIFDRNTNIAYYDIGGKIVNEENTLTSKKGQYHTKSKILYFRKDVVLINPDSETYSDTLIYNTINKTAYFKGPTVIRGEENTIYCEDGWYDTKNDYSELNERPVISSTEQTITADSLFYNNNTSYGIAKGNVQINDTSRSILINGKRGEFWDSKGISYITDSAYAVSYDNADSLFIHGDTLWLHFDKERKAKKMMAYYNVRMFKIDLQGVCDSLIYTMNDSTIRFMKDPILWSGKNQLTADSINVVASGGEIDSLIMFNSSFIISRDTLDAFNQIKGKNMTGYFVENELKKINVDGNAQTVYWIREEDGYLIGINFSEASTMSIKLKDNELQTINYKSSATEKMFPRKEVSKEQERLKGFRWHEHLKPKDKLDIFKVPENIETTIITE
jgi:lipopolysaccharide export system protein LptA